MLHVCVCACPPRMACMHDSQQKWEKKCLYVFKYGYFSCKNMDLLQEGFIHPPEPCDARFITDMCALQTKTPTYSHPNAW